MGKLRKNSFIEGTLIAYASIIVTKILGAFYGIPFYSMIGEAGGVIYACAYNVYNLFLDASTSGIPTAMSIIISEYNTKDLHKTKQKIYKTGMQVVTGLSLTLFVVMQIFAGQIGKFFLEDTTEGVTASEVAISVRVVALCLLVAPILSVRRGYLQGHKFITPSSVSQIIEQVVRIAIVLAGAYVTIILLGQSSLVGVCVALSGAAIGALIASLYLKARIKRNRSILIADTSEDEPYLSKKAIIKKIIKYSVPVVIVSTATHLYSIVNMRLVITGLHNIGFTDENSQIVSSIIATWGIKICMIISSLAMGLTTSLVPNIVSSFVEKKYKEVNFKFNQSISTILLISAPMALGMGLLSNQVYFMFYGQSAFGPTLLKFMVITSTLSSINLVTSMALQSMGKAKLVCSVTILGVVINSCLVLPFIYLLDSIGLHDCAYLGSQISTTIGYSVNLGIVLFALRREYKFKYGQVIKSIGKIVPPLAIMGVVVYLLTLVVPEFNSRMLTAISLCVYGLIGGAVYIFVAYKNKAIGSILGEEAVNKLMRKLHLKKSA